MGRRLPQDEVIDAPLLTMRSIAQRFGNSREGIGRDGGIRTHDPSTPILSLTSAGSCTVTFD
jgi:hypothetical protein